MRLTDTRIRVRAVGQYSTAVGLRETGSLGALRHLFGPAIIVAIVCSIVVVAIWRIVGHPSTDFSQAAVAGLPAEISELFDLQLKDYRATLARLEGNMVLQAILITTSVLLMIRRSDSLNFLGNSIPLSWLHFFVPVMMIGLWLSFGFLTHEAIWGRIRGIEMISKQPAIEYQKALFRDGGYIDGWLLAFVDKPDKSYSGINKKHSANTAFFLVLMIGTLVSATHGAIFGRRCCRLP